MQFALIDETRVEAKPGLKGICPGCGEPVIAKCGTLRIHHWSHAGKRECDSWWEPETAWHRAWKNKFLAEWQEIILPDQRTGEIHVADIRTAHGLVIEFQHSHIDSQERNARQSFYGHMVWVVDGMRLKSVHQRFFKNQSQLFPEIGKPFNLHRPEDYFPAAWLNGFIPVIFDFRNDEGPETYTAYLQRGLTVPS
jgi:competence protein CoiA